MAFVRETGVNSNSQTTHVITLDAAPASGNTLIFVGLSFSVGITGVTDNGGATPAYSNDYSFATNNGTAYFWSRTNITDAPTTVSITLASSQSIRGHIYEFSGIATSSYVGQTNTGETGIYTDSPATSVTTTTANEVGVAWISLSNTQTVTNAASENWTMLSDEGNPGVRLSFYDADLGAAGVKTCDPTLSTGTNPYFGMVTYLAATAAGATFTSGPTVTVSTDTIAKITATGTLA